MSARKQRVRTMTIPAHSFTSDLKDGVLVIQEWHGGPINRVRLELSLGVARMLAFELKRWVKKQKDDVDHAVKVLGGVE